ncbi:MAG: hypothetical protein D6767_04940 [Candidatus Hydrogenedentota bacterium]|nr:MAG: hypothetical protein D6767_04940 [Candidatus Hydrogenedentota bacterium]
MIGLFLLCLATSWILANSIQLRLTEKEYIALRREMIEMDLAYRNLASAIAISFPNESKRLLESLSEYKITEHVHHKKAAKTLLRKLKRNNLKKYFENIHKIAKKAAEKAEKIAQNKLSNWQPVENALIKIASQCRQCHEKTKVSWK